MPYTPHILRPIASQQAKKIQENQKFDNNEKILQK